MWDWAAGALVVEEAGGTVSSYAGDAWRPFARAIVASNGHIHSAVVGETRSVASALELQGVSVGLWHVPADFPTEFL